MSLPLSDIANKMAVFLETHPDLEALLSVTPDGEAQVSMRLKSAPQKDVAFTFPVGPTFSPQKFYSAFLNHYKFLTRSTKASK